MIRSTRWAVRILDLYFDEPRPHIIRADMVRYIQFSRPITGAVCRPACTMLLDLSQTPDRILGKMKSHTRYKIRRADERDQLRYDHSDGKDRECIHRFADYYDRYASMKGLPRISRKRYQILAAQNALDLSFISDTAGHILAASSCLVTPLRVRGLHLAAAFRGTSDSSRRALIGRANRYLRWRDILRFRSQGVEIFDFGGWYTGPNQAEATRVNDWKSEFCGDVVQEFVCEHSATFTGWVAFKLLNWRTLVSERRVALGSGALHPKDIDEGSLPTSF